MLTDKMPWHRSGGQHVPGTTPWQEFRQGCIRFGSHHCTQLALNLPMPLHAVMLQATGINNLKLTLWKMALHHFTSDPEVTQGQDAVWTLPGCVS